jgi:hypothetical protein
VLDVCTSTSFTAIGVLAAAQRKHNNQHHPPKRLDVAFFCYRSTEAQYSTLRLATSTKLQQHSKQMHHSPPVLSSCIPLIYFTATCRHCCYSSFPLIAFYISWTQAPLSIFFTWCTVFCFSWRSSSFQE